MIVSAYNARTYLIDDVKGTELTNSFLAHYTPANDSIQALRDNLAETEAKIAEVAPDVKDSETLTEAKAAIETMLGDLQKSVDEAYADETLPAEYEEVMAPSEEIIAAIEKLLEDAIAEQEKHDIETGIDGVWTTADDMSGVKVFTLSGTQVDTPAKGQVNILKYPDGTVKKVFVK